MVLKFDGIPLDTDTHTPQDFAMADNDIIQVHLPAPVKRVDIQKELSEDKDLVELVQKRPLPAGLPTQPRPQTIVPPAQPVVAEREEEEDEGEEEAEYIMLKVRLANSSDVDKFRIKRVLSPPTFFFHELSVCIIERSIRQVDHCLLREEKVFGRTHTVDVRWSANQAFSNARRTRHGGR